MPPLRDAFGDRLYVALSRIASRATGRGSGISTTRRAARESQPSRPTTSITTKNRARASRTYSWRSARRPPSPRPAATASRTPSGRSARRRSSSRSSADCWDRAGRSRSRARPRRPPDAAFPSTSSATNIPRRSSPPAKPPPRTFANYRSPAPPRAIRPGFPRKSRRSSSTSSASCRSSATSPISSRSGHRGVRPLARDPLPGARLGRQLGDLLLFGCHLGGSGADGAPLRAVRVEGARRAPDIDIDFEHERREEVIQYVYNKYGRERAGIAAEVISLPRAELGARRGQGARPPRSTRWTASRSAIEHWHPRRPHPRAAARGGALAVRSQHKNVVKVVEEIGDFRATYRSTSADS